MKELGKAGAHICSEAETEALRGYLFHERGFNVEAVGRDAGWIAEQAGIKVNKRVKVLVTPIHLIGVGEDLSREKLCPVLGLYVANGAQQAIRQARGALAVSQAPAIRRRSTRQINRVILDYAAAVEVYRVVVNAPCSQGASGL